MTTRTFAFALSGKEKYQKGKGNNTLDDLDKIAEAFETNKANLLRNLNNQNILIQMKELEVQYSLIQGGYIQATYQVYNQTTKEEKWVKGNFIGSEIDSVGLGSLNFSNKIEFAEGEYIKKITALRDGVLKYIFSVHITVASRLTGETRRFQPLTVTPTNVFVQTITLNDVACLTGDKGGNPLLPLTKLPNGLGAWGGVVANDVQIANPQDQIKNLGLQLSEFEQVLNKYGIHDAKELDVKIGKWQQNTGQPSPSQPVVTPQPSTPTDYQQIKDELAKWTNNFAGQKPEDIKKQLQLLTSLQPQLDDLRQKYNDSQTELTATKDKLSKTEVDKHLLELRVTDLNSEITRNNDRITELEKRPNITNDQWANDYSKRPTQVEFDKVKSERDQRPDISLTDYQSLLNNKGELAKWTTVFPNEGPNNIASQMNQLKSDLGGWTSKFLNQTAQEVKNELDKLKTGPTQKELDDLNQKLLDYKKDQIGERIEKMIESFETELGLWSVNLRKDIRDFFGTDYHSLLTKHLTLNKLNDDNYFKQVENTIKFVVYSLASERAAGIQNKSVLQSNTTDHDTRKDMIVLFNKLCSIDTSQLFPIETDVTKNPLYSNKVGTAVGKLSTYKLNNTTLLEKWKVKPATTTTIKQIELEKLMSDYKKKLEKNDYEDLNNFLESQEEFVKNNNEYAKKQMERVKKRLLETNKIEEEDLEKLSQIKTELVNLEKESEEQQAQIEIPPKQN